MSCDEEECVANGVGRSTMTSSGVLSTRGDGWSDTITRFSQSVVKSVTKVIGSVRGKGEDSVERGNKAMD